jgi:phosphoenolpyruvate carboxykinase (ATP)
MASTAFSSAVVDLSQASEVLRNPSVAELVEHAVLSGDKLASNGSLVAYTGKYTGRTPKDKHTVQEPGSEANIWWENNAEMSAELFRRIESKAAEYVRGKPTPSIAFERGSSWSGPITHSSSSSS